jgi:hypothetical protein
MMMKKIRVFKRRKDNIKQHYHVLARMGSFNNKAERLSIIQNLKKSLSHQPYPFTGDVLEDMKIEELMDLGLFDIKKWEMDYKNNPKVKNPLEIYSIDRYIMHRFKDKPSPKSAVNIISLEEREKILSRIPPRTAVNITGFERPEEKKLLEDKR